MSPLNMNNMKIILPTKQMFQNSEVRQIRQDHWIALQIIELELNSGVKPFGPIRRQDTKIGGCHLAFFPIVFVQGRGLNSGKMTSSEFSLRLKLPHIIWVDWPIGTPPYSPALLFRSMGEIHKLIEKSLSLWWDPFWNSLPSHDESITSYYSPHNNKLLSRHCLCTDHSTIHLLLCRHYLWPWHHLIQQIQLQEDIADYQMSDENCKYGLKCRSLRWAVGKCQ